MGGLKAKAHVKTAYHLGWIGDQLPHLKPNYIGEQNGLHKPRVGFGKVVLK